MRNLWHFLQYHNAVPVAIGIIFLGSGITFAATNPEAIYSAEQQVISIDNTYIADKDLSAYTPTIEITGVTEDADNYYVAYKFNTIDIKDALWQDITKEESLKVSRADLGPYRDLGVYVTQQLHENVLRELARLRDTQEIEKKNVSQKVVATTYGGLVGQMLNDSTEVLPGYTPVVQGPPKPVQVAAAAAPDSTPSTDSTGSPQAGSGQASGTLAVGSVLSGDPSDTEPPYLQILGAASILLRAGDYYIDLGAVAADNGRADLVEVSLYLNGTKVERVYMPSAKAGEWTVTYEARDKAGNITRAERHITVVAASSTPAPEPEPEPAPVEPSSESTDSPAPDSTSSTSTPQAEPTPTPTPEPIPTSTPEPTPEPVPTPTLAPPSDLAPDTASSTTL